MRPAFPLIIRCSKGLVWFRCLPTNHPDAEGDKGVNIREKWVGRRWIGWLGSVYETPFIKSVPYEPVFECSLDDGPMWPLLVVHLLQCFRHRPKNGGGILNIRVLWIELHEKFEVRRRYGFLVEEPGA